MNKFINKHDVELAIIIILVVVNVMLIFQIIE